MVTQQGRAMWAFLHSLGGGHKLNHQFSQLLQPGQWKRVISRIGHIPTPSVPSKPSKYSTPAGKH
jgi:hypothetical protein